ncbi:hypothetical protein [Streptomyces sp. NPDC060131]|uniref:hypothetical protein n=1 Tax=unclassified Streptomyces TaxID=2593676 RepID=UPI0036691A55
MPGTVHTSRITDLFGEQPESRAAEGLVLLLGLRLGEGEPAAVPQAEDVSPLVHYEGTRSYDRAAFRVSADSMRGVIASRVVQRHQRHLLGGVLVEVAR